MEVRADRQLPLRRHASGRSPTIPAASDTPIRSSWPSSRRRDRPRSCCTSRPASCPGRPGWPRRLAAPAVRGARQAAAAAARLRRSSAPPTRSITRGVRRRRASTSPPRSSWPTTGSCRSTTCAKKHRLDAGVPEALGRGAGRRAAPRRSRRAARHDRAGGAARPARREDSQERQAGRRSTAGGEGDRPAGPGHQLVRRRRADPRHGAAAHASPSTRRRRSSSRSCGRARWRARSRVAARVAHAHPACGNGVAWWLEHRRGDRAAVLAEGALDLGGEAKPPAKTLEGREGRPARPGRGRPRRQPRLRPDRDRLHRHRDRASRAASGTWPPTWPTPSTTATRTPTSTATRTSGASSAARRRPSGKARRSLRPIPPGSVLGQWREAAADPARQAEADKLAEQVQTLLTGPRPAKEKDPDRVLYDALVAARRRPVQGARPDAASPSRDRAAAATACRRSGSAAPDGKPSMASLVVGDSVIEVRLPAALFRDREFVVEGKLDGAAGDRVVQFDVRRRTAPDATLRWDGKSPVVASPTRRGVQAAARRATPTSAACFPLFICFPKVVPTDEVVTPEDVPPRGRAARSGCSSTTSRSAALDRLWDEHRFVSRQPVAENDYLPQFIGYVTQDQPKELLAVLRAPAAGLQEAGRGVREGRGGRRSRSNWTRSLEFAGRAYRRPLAGEGEGRPARPVPDDPRRRARRTTRRSAACWPACWCRRRSCSASSRRRRARKPGPVNDWELATRLSYFLWSSHARRRAAPARRRRASSATRRCSRSRRGGCSRTTALRALAIEFGTQWIHVRGFDELKEKNEKLFPTFDADLRKAIYEESILFFQDLFQSDRPVTQILDADYTFLNETLAKHYGIPGVTGPQWRRVEGVRKYGRGGILAWRACRRSSPARRGPARSCAATGWSRRCSARSCRGRRPNVPQLPEEEGGADKLTTRQLVEKHASDAVVRRLPRADRPVRLRPREVRPHRPLRDEGPRRPAGRYARRSSRTAPSSRASTACATYLLTKKKDVIVRLFCRKLLGYALGRASTLSDTVADRRDGGGAEQERRAAVGRGADDRAEPAVSDDPGQRVYRGLSNAIVTETQSQRQCDVRLILSLIPHLYCDYLSESTSDGDCAMTTTRPPLPPHVPARRRRDDGPAVAGVAAGLGRRQAEARARRSRRCGSRACSAGNGFHSKEWWAKGEGAEMELGQGARAARARSARRCCSSAASTTRKP